MSRLPSDVDAAVGGGQMLPDSPTHQSAHQPAPDPGAAGTPAVPPIAETPPPSIPDAAPGPAPDAGPTDSASPGPPVSPFRDGLAQRGFDLSGFETDEAVFDYLQQQQQQAHSRIQELQQQAGYLQSQIPAPAEQALVQPGDKEPYWPEAPKWDPSWEKRIWVERNEQTGQNELRGDPGDIQRYRAYQEWEQGRDRALRQDPYACVRQPFEDRLVEFRQQIAEDRTAFYQQQQVEQYYQSFVVQHQERFNHCDEQGQPLIDQRTGQPVLTQDGMAFLQLCDQLVQSGTHPMSVPGFALQQLNGMRAGGAPAAAANTPAPAQTNLPQPGTQPGTALPAVTTPAQQMKDNFVAEGVEGARRAANRAGSVADAAQPHAPHMDPDQDPKAMLEQDFRAAGITVPGVP